MTISIRVTKITTSSLFVFVILAAGLFTSVPIYAQVAGATLSGTVTDPSGAAIPNAEVTIKNTATGVERDVTADSAGFYSASNLLPGSYDVTFSAPGFAKLVQPNLTLEVGGQQLLNRKMQVGQVNQTVEVTTEAPTIQLTSSALSAEVDSTTMRELPLNGRDWTQLATLQPGVLNIRTQAPTGGAAPRSNRGFGNQVAAVGHRPYENNYRVDGISVNDYSNGSPGSVLGVQLGVDAISEFSVLTSNYSSEYGRTSGGVINAITKSGTNAFHGSAYWFLRDEGLDAKNFFDLLTKPPFHRNQFGASGGAPIIKNKTFVFADYEGIRQDKGVSFHDKVPSPAARGIGPNGQPTVAVVNGSPLPASGPGAAPNPDPVTHIDTAVLPYLALWPLPNAGLTGNGDVGFFDASGAAVVSENYVTARVDHTISAKDNLAASFFNETSSILQPDALLMSTTAAESKRYMGELEENHIFSATLTNTARLGFNRTVGVQAQPGTALNPLADDTSLGILPGHNVPQIGVPGIATESGGIDTPPYNVDVENSFQVYDDAFVTRGKHSLKFGFGWEHLQYNSDHRGIYNGVYSFPSLEGFLTNQPTSLNLLLPNLPAGLGAGTKEIAIRQNAFGGYAQDDWLVRPNLTLNLGLRYEPVTLPTEAQNLFMGLTSLTSPGGPVPMAHTWQTNQTLKNFAPRVGFAWDPFHDGKTSVRGGFGIFDVLPLPWETIFNQGGAFPFSVRATVGGLAAGSFPTGAVSALAFNPKKISVSYFDQNPKRNYAMNWNFNIQRQISPTLTATLGYAGSHTVHQPFLTGATNTVLPTLTSAGYLWPFPVGSGTKLNPDVGVITSATSDDSAHYHGLQAEIVKKLNHGIQFQGSYTFSKCIDYGSSGHITDPFENSQPDMFFFDSTERRGLCDFDQRHNFVGNVVWLLPTPTFAGAFGKNVMGGWELSSIFTISSGMPTTATIAGDPLGSGISETQLPDRLTGPGCSNPVNPGNINDYFNLSCFSPPVAPASFAAVCQPAAASVAAVIPNTCMNLLGNEARNSVIGPRLTELDFSMFKDISIRKVSEQFHVQFRAEFFNILNHPNSQVPNQGGDGNTDIFNQDGTTVAGAGSIASMATDPREIQFGLKLIW